MVKYMTKSGDTFEKIAYEQLGDGKYLVELLRANAEKLREYEFKAGEEIKIPEVEEETALVKLPQWFK